MLFVTTELIITLRRNEKKYLRGKQLFRFTNKQVAESFCYDLKSTIFACARTPTTGPDRPVFINAVSRNVCYVLILLTSATLHLINI